MALETLRALCCCGSRPSPEPAVDEHVIPNENTPLIPPDIDNPSYTDESYLEDQRLQERLTTVVRAKEGKMVNLGSHIPFNLHNQTLVSDRRTVSRSASGSMDVSNHMYTPRYMESRSPSPSHDEDSSRSSRFRPVSDQPRPTPILNVKLVNYNGPTTSRGRARERPGTVTQVPKPPQPQHLPGGTEGQVAGTGGEGEISPSKPIASKKPAIDLGDTSSLVMSWGD